VVDSESDIKCGFFHGFVFVNPDILAQIQIYSCF
jgi:hypothetical protein